ncbi:hypothetical protein HFN_1123 [Helicobacter fennelliae MRY12-0050]|uniref:Uncharacterized protein n=1 Tax=Helicobacter fennelliae MRY12-0050 TaxID=1325130 RepID=T1DWS2_9HELI|nr:hypothetical protein HFN_1123 [Helicobacter fennelliae MRY12-0050]
MHRLCAFLRFFGILRFHKAQKPKNLKSKVFYGLPRKFL